MKPRFFIALLSAAGWLPAAERCEDVQFCARVAGPRQVFFVGEAVAERQRDGRLPEYRFAVREILLGLEPGTEHVVIESEEGTPPTGPLLIQARWQEDGNLARGECDLVAAESAAGPMRDQLGMLKSALASLSVTVRDVRGRAPADVRITIDGPVGRLADRDARFTDLAAGAYRITAAAPGYETKSHDTELTPGSCPALEMRLAGSAEITGIAAPGVSILAIDADSRAEAARAASDTDGRYRLSALPPGRYVLSNGSSFYPGSPHRSDATVVDLGVGAKVEVNVWSLKRE